MPLYFFDTDNGDRHHRDDDGLELPDDAAARAMAQETLPDMAHDALPDGESRAFTVLVRTHDSTLLYSVSMTMAGQWHDGRGVSERRSSAAQQRSNVWSL